MSWPHEDWETARYNFRPNQDRLIENAFDDRGPLGTTYALVVIKGGRLVFERYAGSLPSFSRPPETVTANTRLLSWSMAKSILHAVLGILIANGQLELDSVAPIDEWHSPNDLRGKITIKNLLEMRDGLDFSEDYRDSRVSDVIEMLFGTGQNNVSRYAIQKPGIHEPGTVFNYSSGTSNILSSIVARVVGYGDRYLEFLNDKLFVPLGMSSATPTLDESGVWVASSYVHATARDFAKFGYLYLSRGRTDTHEIIPEDWVDYARNPQAFDQESGSWYGAHWWVANDDLGTFWASGYEGQLICVVPGLDLVIVRLGKTDLEYKTHLAKWLTEFYRSFTE